VRAPRSCDVERLEDQRACREAHVHEHRDEHASSAVVDPHHEHPVGRQEREGQRGGQERDRVPEFWAAATAVDDIGLPPYTGK
jgi:hypothetical protein